MSSSRTVEFVRGILHERTKRRGLDANVSMVVTESRIAGVTDEDVRSAPVSTGARVRAAIEKISDRLGINPEYAEGRRQFWEAHPELVRVMASDNFLDERCDEEGDASFDTLEYIFNQPGVREFFPVNTHYVAEQQRASAEVTEALALREEMLGWFETARKHQFKGAHPSLWPKEIARETARLAAMDLTQLRQEREARLEKKRLAGLSKEELRAEVRKPVTQNQQKLYSERYPVLPPYIFLPNSMVKLELNRETLLRLSTVDREHYALLMRKYGHQQLTDRINSAA